MNSLYIAFDKYKYLYLYYIILFFICISWTKTALIPPPFYLRIIVSAAVFLPLIKYIWLLPSIIILFIGIRFNSIAPFGYIPQDWRLYSYIVLIISIIHTLIYKQYTFLISKSQLLLIAYIFIIDAFNSILFSDFLFYSLLLIIVYESLQSDISINLFYISFVLASLVLSIYFFIYGQEFAQIYNYSSGINRTAWVDPNYFGSFLGIGNILSFYLLFFLKKIKFNLIYIILFISCIITSSLVIILQGSRGTLLAIGISIVTMLFTSKIRMIYKLSISIVLITSVIFLVDQGAFSLVLYRIQEDTTGSGRFQIWTSKLHEFYYSIKNWFGSGYGSSFLLWEKIDCHNEFISMLINYGMIGGIILLQYIFYFFKKGMKDAFILACSFYIIISFTTLSPLSNQTGWCSIPFLIVLLQKRIDRNQKYYD